MWMRNPPTPSSAGLLSGDVVELPGVGVEFMAAEDPMGLELAFTFVTIIFWERGGWAFSSAATVFFNGAALPMNSFKFVPGAGHQTSAAMMIKSNGRIRANREDDFRQIEAFFGVLSGS